MKFIIKSCEFSNILPFGNIPQRVNFQNGIFKIVGDNRDKGGSNGAGKTSIMNIISYGIYGKPFEDDIEDVQNYTNNSKKTPASVTIYASKFNTDYKIVRNKAGSSSSVELWECKDGDWINTTLGKGVTATNERIVELVGMNFDMFCLSHIFSGNVVPFLKRSVADQRKIIDVLFNTSELTEYADKAKELKSKLETELKIQNALKASADQLAQSSKMKILEATNKMESWDQAQKTKIQTAKSIISEEYDFHEQLEILNSIEELSSLINSSVNPPISEINNKSSVLKTELTRTVSQLNHLKEGNCPFCQQSFTSPEKFNELKNKIEQLQSEFATLQNELEELNILKAELTEERQHLVNKAKFKTKDELNSFKSKQDKAKMNLEALVSEINPHVESLHALKEMAVDNSKFDMSEINRITDELEHVKLLIQLLTNRDSIVRTSIISSQTALLNSRITMYSKMLDLPQVLHFDSNMKCSVMEFGRETSYGNLSAGEKRRANLALSYAFRDLVTIKYGGMNVLLLDEIDGGSLDTQACHSIVKSLNEIGSGNCVMVISHNEVVSQKINNQITVVKQNGFSTVT